MKPKTDAFDVASFQVLTFSPPILEDELIYSYMARWHVLSGYRNRREFMIQAVGRERRLLPNEVFVGGLGIESGLGTIASADDILLKHTLYPYYRWQFPNALCDELEAGVHRIRRWWRYHGFDYGSLTVENLRFCPECQREQLAKLGFAFWSRSHNLPHVEACTRHELVLQSIHEISGCVRKHTGLGTESFVLPRPGAIAERRATSEQLAFSAETISLLHLDPLESASSNAAIDWLKKYF